MTLYSEIFIPVWLFAIISLAIQPNWTEQVFYQS